jgi:bifunctional non-homologous end joining protein LigD
VAKRADSPYEAGRTARWVKVRVDRTGDFVVVGFTDPSGGRASLGALHLGAYQGGALVYAGRVGTGFSDGQLRELRQALEEDRRAGPPCSGELPTGGGHHWVEPRLVVEVRYKERTRDGLLRQPVFLRVRDDKRVEDCADDAPWPTDEAPPPPAAAAVAERKVPFTNLDKVFWPEERYTKGDLIEYYRRIAPWILPYLRDRPVVLTRYPDGIAGKSFFQKDAPDFAPAWIRTERMWSEHAQREIDYFVCNDVETLLYLVNLGTIPLHVWSSRVGAIAQPDWCILDLDPKGAPFADVVRLARGIHELGEEIELETFVKTSGSTGIHVLVPLGGQCNYEQSRSLGELLGRVITARLPDIATIWRPLGKRGGRVYVDYLQNGHGRLLVAPFSVRPLRGAPVSTPLSWGEVDAGLEPGRFTIRTVPERFERLGEDPLRGVFEARPDLGRALALLGERLQRR